MSRRLFTAASLTGIAAAVQALAAPSTGPGLALLALVLFIVGIVAWRFEGVR